MPKHGRVEDYPRIDAVAVSRLDGVVTFRLGEYQALALHERDTDTCGLCIGGRLGEWFPLVRLPNGYGKGQPFFICVCGRRIRHLYVTDGGFRCRQCAGLAYSSQQSRRKDRRRYYLKGMMYVWKNFGLVPMPDNEFDFLQYRPWKISGMHTDTYRRHVLRLREYQRRYKELLLADIAEAEREKDREVE